jgi:GTP pyrophosphokinase
VPLEYKLKNGDLVEIITGNVASPSRDWINIVASSDTRAKIRAWFKKEKREENIERGREMLIQEAKHLGYNPKEVVRDDKLALVAEKLSLLSKDDLLASIGYGGIQMQGILKKLVDLYKETMKEYTPESVTQMIEKLKSPAAPNSRGHGILVEGEAGVLVRLARCCNPIPGDNITGYITRGRGVSVHRTDCPNVLQDKELTRMIEVSWDVDQSMTYNVELEIRAGDTNGVLQDVIAVPSEMKLNIHSVNASQSKGNKTIILGVEVRNSVQVENLMGKLRQVKDVYTVSRVMGLQI